MALLTAADDEYASSEDSDFAPDDAACRDSSPSSPDHDHGDGAGVSGESGPDEAGLSNSGDEAVIHKARKTRRRNPREQDPDEKPHHDRVGRNAGVIKTRSQHAIEAERKAFPASGPVTIDVDSLWAEMSRPASALRPEATTQTAEHRGISSTGNIQGASGAGRAGPVPTDGDRPRLVRIQRTYTFAGKDHTEEKLVPWDSAEAKLFLETSSEHAGPDGSGQQSNRRPRRAFRSAFEPAAEPILRRSDLDLGIAARMNDGGSEVKKLTTLEKSRVDWAGYVDKEGIVDELKLAGKSKHSYAERQSFLARSEARRQEDERRVRLAARV